MSTFLVILEVFCFCLGGVLFVYFPSRRVAESLSLGIGLAFMLLSVIFQISFLLGVPRFSFLPEGLLLIFILRHALKNTSTLKEILAKIKHFWLNHKMITSAIAVYWLLLFLLAIIIPPSNVDSMTYNLSRVLLFQQENSLFLSQVTTSRQALFVVGTDILNHAFLRFYSDYGVGLFSFLAYCSIGLGTYALSRHYFSTQISLLATLIIISMPSLCFQATTTKNDIFTASAAVFCFISVYRLLDFLNIKDLSLTILGLFFGLSAKTIFLAFFPLFSFIFGYLIWKKYGFFAIYNLILKNKLYFILLISPILIMSQIWLLFHNIFQFSDLVGNNSIKMVINNNDRLIAGLANLTRYLLQSIHFFPFDIILSRKLNINLDNYLNSLYNSLFQPIFGTVGMGYLNNKPYIFSVKFAYHENWSWYGIAGFFLILPSVFFSAFKRNYFLRAVSLTLMGFFLIVCFAIYWTPWNARYLTLFYSSSGICIAFWLQALYPKLKNRGINILFILFFLILISACLFNSSKPLAAPSFDETFKPNILFYD